MANEDDTAAPPPATCRGSVQVQLPSTQLLKLAALACFVLDLVSGVSGGGWLPPDEFRARALGRGRGALN
jgi:hypothetical protein